MLFDWLRWILESLVSVSRGLQRQSTGQRSSRSGQRLSDRRHLRHPHRLYFPHGGSSFQRSCSFSWTSVSDGTQRIHPSVDAFYAADGHGAGDRHQGEERCVRSNAAVRRADRRELFGRSVVRCKWSIRSERTSRRFVSSVQDHQMY